MSALLNTAEGIAAVVIAAYVASIGTFQWTNAREKLRLDLYNRRFDVYASTMAYMQALIVWEPVTQSERIQQRKAFIRAMFESDFLFEDNPCIPALLEELNKRSFPMVDFYQRNGEPRAMQLPDFAQKLERNEAHVRWILEARQSLKTMLTPYLGFRHRMIAPRLRRWFGRKLK